MNTRRKRQLRSGFTLMELLTTVAIMAVLVGLVLGVAGYAGRKAAHSRAVSEIEKLKTAMEEYKVVRGALPGNVGETKEMSDENFWNDFTNAVAPTSIRIEDLQNRDPWGSSYRYERQGKHQYRLWSLGTDMENDTGDDIDSSKGGY